MREIKVRAWHKALEKYLNSQEWHNYGPVFICGELSSEDHEIEQFTGLHDKNGKEIYENDFVYIAGSGITLMSWPFIDLYEAGAENDIGQIKGNVHTHPEM